MHATEKILINPKYSKPNITSIKQYASLGLWSNSRA